jgi:hypothetical protein
MSPQYRLVQSGKTASGGCSAGPRFVRAVAPRIIIIKKENVESYSMHENEETRMWNMKIIWRE